MSFEPIVLKKGNDTKILIIYTGGTLGMVYDDVKKTLVPFKFHDTLRQLPELNQLPPEIHILSFKKPIDSSDVNAAIYLELAGIIKKEYNNYDGFLIIHGTDTMAFTASALSFLIQNPQKPIILTGAQLPIGIPRTDARENLITSIEIAAAKKDGKPIVPEVCIYFNGRLLRGNRARKRESSQFDAFVYIDYKFNQIRYVDQAPVFSEDLSDKVSVLTLFPGINRDIVNKYMTHPPTQAVIMQTFGSGNAPSADWFIDCLKHGIDQGKHILNITQCSGGKVIMGKYASSKRLLDIGVISGSDMTLEAAVGKMMWGLEQKTSSLKEIFAQDIAGEVSLS
jgi:L-asparaginase